MRNINTTHIIKHTHKNMSKWINISCMHTAMSTLHDATIFNYSLTSETAMFSSAFAGYAYVKKLGDLKIPGQVN